MHSFVSGVLDGECMIMRLVCHTCHPPPRPNPIIVNHPINHFLSSPFLPPLALFSRVPWKTPALLKFTFTHLCNFVFFPFLYKPSSSHFPYPSRIPHLPCPSSVPSLFIPPSPLKPLPLYTPLSLYFGPFVLCPSGESCNILVR